LGFKQRLLKVTTTELRQRLTTAGLSQRAAARALDINERTMRRYASGALPVPKTVELALQVISGAMKEQPFE
jgi:hypothetical protein